MVTIRASITDGASPALRALLDSLSGQEAKDLNEVGGRGAVIASREYHRGFQSEGGWKGLRYLGANQSSGLFGANVAAGWSMDSATAQSATITNDAEHYRHKVTGGEIRPKRAKALTIPLILEAKGLRARTYQQNTGRKLFTIKGRNFLFERIETVTSGSRGNRNRSGSAQIKQNKLRAVYALRKSVYQEPWDGALPPDNLIAQAFIDAYSDELMAVIDAV